MADRREMLEAALEEVLEPDEGKPVEDGYEEVQTFTPSVSGLRRGQAKR